MAERCTKGSIMCRGGMIELSSRAAWVRVGQGSSQRILQVTDATFLSRLGSADVVVLDTPLEFTPDASMFESTATLPGDVRRRVTSAARAVGVDHLDRPMGRDEMVARDKLVTKTLNRITHATGGGTQRRAEIIKKFGQQLNELMTTRGADDIVDAVTAILSENPTISPPAMMRALELVPTMNQRLGVHEPLRAPGRDVAPARPTRALAAVGFTAGAHPGALLHAELSDPRSVAPHAILRFLERVDGIITPEMIDASRQILRAKHAGVGIDDARRRLTTLKTTAGLDQAAIHRARAVITALVTDAADAALGDPGRPVIAGRPTANLGAEADRVILSVNHEGRTLELLVRAARLTTEPGRPPRVAVEVVTMWEPATVLASKARWNDPSVDDAHADDWNRATENELYAAIAA